MDYSIDLFNIFKKLGQTFLAEIENGYFLLVAWDFNIDRRLEAQKFWIGFNLSSNLSNG